MQIYNQTGFPHEFTMAMDKAGHEFILLVVKGTFDFPDAPGGPVRPSDDPGPAGHGRRIHRRPRLLRPALGNRLRPPQAPLRHRPQRRRLRPRPPPGHLASASASRSAPGPRSSTSSATANGAPAARSSPPPRPSPSSRRPISYDVAWGGTDRLDPDDPLPGAYLQQPRRHRLVAAEAPAPHPRPRPPHDPGRRRGHHLPLRRLHAR